MAVEETEEHRQAERAIAREKYQQMEGKSVARPITKLKDQKQLARTGRTPKVPDRLFQEIVPMEIEDTRLEVEITLKIWSSKDENVTGLLENTKPTGFWTDQKIKVRPKEKDGITNYRKILIGFLSKSDMGYNLYYEDLKNVFLKHPRSIILDSSFTTTIRCNDRLLIIRLQDVGSSELLEARKNLSPSLL